MPITSHAFGVFGSHRIVSPYIGEPDAHPTAANALTGIIIHATGTEAALLVVSFELDLHR